MAFLGPIFTKLTNAQEHCVKIAYTELHPNQTIYVGRMGGNSFNPQTKILLSLP
jgi:hypothetical protein